MILTPRRSIRSRLTAVATVVVAVVLAASAVGLVLLQRAQLSSSLDTSLSQRADTIVVSIDEALRSGSILTSNIEDHAAQLVMGVGDDARAVAATHNLVGAPPLAAAPADGNRQEISDVGGLPLPEPTYRVLSRRVDTPDGPAVLHVAESTDDLNDTVAALALALAIAVPVVVAMLAALMWWLVGRTLRPVEAIRSEVADISGAELHRRVPVPEQDDEIARLATTMNGMLDRIDASAERQRRFVADASHELRTPITRIRTEVEVDINQPQRADHDATNRLVLEETGALQRLLEDLLHLARSDAGVGPYREQPVDLDDIVLAEVRRQRAGATVDFDLTGVSAAHLVGDADQLTRVVRNLLGNAARHARTNVRVGLAERDAQIELTVADDGAGVPADVGDRIFERFTRADDSRSRDDGGTGLGLAIVRDIVGRHGGTVVLDERSAPGARFVVTLPTNRP